MKNKKLKKLAMKALKDAIETALDHESCFKFNVDLYLTEYLEDYEHDSYLNLKLTPAELDEISQYGTRYKTKIKTGKKSIKLKLKV